MKTAVLDFLKIQEKTAEKFNQGYQLLLKTPNVNSAMLRNYNVKGFTPQSLETLCYDLQKLHSISDADIRNHIAIKSQETRTKNQDETKDVFSNVIRDMNDEAKKGFKLFAQYPFLRNEDCPDEFKILTADSITAFHNYKNAHTELFNKVANVENSELDNEEIYKIASGLLKNFELNHEIHAELEHYQKTGEILGNHEIFAGLRRERGFNDIPDLELKQKIKNIGDQITRAKKGLKMSKNPEKIAELETKIKTLSQDKADLEKIFEEKKKGI